MTTSPSSIPEAAVEAALSAMFPLGAGRMRQSAWKPLIRSILEAALPHLEAIK